MTAAERADLKELRDEMLVGFRRIEDLIEQRRRDDESHDGTVDARLRNIEIAVSNTRLLGAVAVIFGSPLLGGIGYVAATHIIH